MIENTTDRDPLLHMLGLMSDGNNGYIEGMEAAGQRQFVGSEQLPTRSPIAELEALGFVFGPVDPRDDLFRPCTLPDGWVKRGTDHSMWSEIVDDKGRRRVSIFYKAAFYDRSAHASLVHPASRLSDAIYADECPATIELDELLTADAARDYLSEALRENARRLDGWAAGEPEYLARHERIKALLALVEKANV